MKTVNYAKSSGAQSVEGLHLVGEESRLDLSEGISSDLSECAEDVAELPLYK